MIQKFKVTGTVTQGMPDGQTLSKVNLIQETFNPIGFQNPNGSWTNVTRKEIAPPGGRQIEDFEKDRPVYEQRNFLCSILLPKQDTTTILALKPGDEVLVDVAKVTSTLSKSDGRPYTNVDGTILLNSVQVARLVQNLASGNKANTPQGNYTGGNESGGIYQPAVQPAVANKDPF